MPIEAAQQNLGHASLATTAVYLTIESNRRMKAVERFWIAPPGPYATASGTGWAIRMPTLVTGSIRPTTSQSNMVPHGRHSRTGGDHQQSVSGGFIDRTLGGPTDPLLPIIQE